MGEIRFVNGYECQSCYDLYPTERRAKNCFDRCSIDYKSKKDIPKTKVVLCKGFECLACMKVYSHKSEARNCCNVKYEQYTESPNPYDVIGDWERKKKQKAEDKENGIK